MTEAKATAAVPTANGSRYLQQLCKHWSHKFETEFDAQAGRINLGETALHLTAAPDALTLTLTTGEAAALDRMETVIADHLKRFAFREDLTVEWVRA